MALPFRATHAQSLPPPPDSDNLRAAHSRGPGENSPISGILTFRVHFLSRCMDKIQDTVKHANILRIVPTVYITTSVVYRAKGLLLCQ